MNKTTDNGTALGTVIKPLPNTAEAWVQSMLTALDTERREQIAHNVHMAQHPASYPPIDGKDGGAVLLRRVDLKIAHVRALLELVDDVSAFVSDDAHGLAPDVGRLRTALARVRGDACP